MEQEEEGQRDSAVQPLLSAISNLNTMSHRMDLCFTHETHLDYFFRKFIEAANRFVVTLVVLIKCKEIFHGILLDHEYTTIL